MTVMSGYDPDDFARQITAFQERLDHLISQADSAQHTAENDQILESMHVALEELRTAEAELFIQAEELQTAQAEAESEFRRYLDLFNFSPDGYLTTDLFGVILESNQAGAAMLGVLPHRLTGKPLLAYIVQPDRSAFRAMLNALKAGHTQARLEANLAPRDEQPLAVEFLVSSQPSPTTAGRELRWCLRDVSARKRAEEEREQALRDLRRLANRLETLREEEQERLARRVHDDLGGLLTGIKFDLVRLRRDLPPDLDEANVVRLAEVTHLVETAIQTARGIATELRPAVLDTLGLVAALEWSLGQFHQRTNLATELLIDSTDLQCPADVATAVYRVFQELLLNIAKHAQATQVQIRLAHSDQWLKLEVQDNGIGISPQAAASFTSIGLLGSRERLRQVEGTLELSNPPSGGTLALVQVPLPTTGTPRPT